MTREEYEASKTGLSKRARKMLDRIERGAFYRPHVDGGPTLDELYASGVIKRVGRVVTIEACYVPAFGYRPFQCERFGVEESQ